MAAEERRALKMIAMEGALESCYNTDSSLEVRTIPSVNNPSQALEGVDKF